MNERTASSYRAFGDPAQPPAVLIIGAIASMLWWPDEFCERLANRGRFIIRYDTATPATRRYMNTGNPLQDMADDAIRVLDGCGLSSAHVVGMPLGGMIAQLAALNTRRVASVTVISSSPFVEGNTDLPGVSPAYLDHLAQFHEVNWTDRAEAIRFLVEDSRSISG